MKNLILCMVAFIFLVSCKSEVNSDDVLVPFQQEVKGKWGIYSLTSNKLIFSDKMDSVPVILSNNRFAVKTNRTIGILFH